MLLTNDGTLPLSTVRKTRGSPSSGSWPGHPRYQGAGSSAVNPTRVVSGLEALTRRLRLRRHVEFGPGYRLDVAL